VVKGGANRFADKLIQQRLEKTMSMKHLLSAAVAGLMLSSAAAFAAVTMETGIIQTLDTTKLEIVLDSGKTFDAKAVELTSFKVGDKVTVSYELKDGKMIAAKVEAATN
jgi:Protein of unknown function (DUF1344)